jgi:hypothetical protein
MRQEAIVAKNPGLANSALLKPISGMVKDDSYGRGVGRRLRVAAAELGFSTQQALADAIKAKRATVDAWFNGRALPPVSYLQIFTQAGITLEWLFYGDMNNLSYQKAINLKLRMDGDPPPYIPPKPEFSSRPDASRALAKDLDDTRTRQRAGSRPAARRLKKKAAAV